MSLILRVPWGRLLAPFIHQSPSQSQAFVSDIHRWRWRLVEQTEAHVVVGLLLLLLLGGLGAASVAPPAAAAPPEEAAAPEPPEGTEASLADPEEISWKGCQSHVAKALYVCGVV